MALEVRLLATMSETLSDLIGAQTSYCNGGYCNPLDEDPNIGENYDDNMLDNHCQEPLFSFWYQSGLSVYCFPQDEVLGLGSDDSSNDEEIADYKERLKKLRRHGIKEGVSDSDDEDEKQDKGDGEEFLKTSAAVSFNELILLHVKMGFSSMLKSSPN